MAHQLTSLSSQRGASVSSIVLFLIVIVVVGKLIIAIVPAHLSDYQLTKILAAQLNEANSSGDSAKQFVDKVNKQLSINASYDTNAEDIFTFTNERSGQLAIVKKYETTNHFFSNVYIVSRFEGDINASSAK